MCFQVRNHNLDQEIFLKVFYNMELMLNIVQLKIQRYISASRMHLDTVMAYNVLTILVGFDKMRRSGLKIHE